MTDDFDQIVSGLEGEFDDVIPTSIPDYAKMSNLELMQAWLPIKNDLIDRGVALLPEAPDDQDKQSVYYGLLWEMRRRNLV